MRGAQTVWCEHCKLNGHKKDDCWFLHPHLRPKGPKKQGGDRRQGSDLNEKRRKGLSPKIKEKGEWVSERVESTSAFKGPSSNETQTYHMRQLMKQLSLLLIKNSEQKTFGISINHIVSSKNSHWILDSGATDHMTGNENLLVNFNKYNTK
jgi:hypothetical protein